jgi:hypothetical protein
MIRVEVATDVAAPVETVRNVYADYSNWPHLFPTIKGVRLIRRDGQTVVLDIDHTEGHVLNELVERSPGEIELREVKRHYTARFENSFEPIPGGTHFRINGEIHLTGVARLLRPFLPRYVRRQMERLQLHPVKVEAEARALRAASTKRT